MDDKELEKFAKEFEIEQKQTPEEMWRVWNNSKSPQDLSNIIHQFHPLINKFLQVYKNNPIDDTVIKADLTTQVIKGIEGYNPKHGVRLITYIYPYLQKTSRFVQQNSNAVRIPENKIQMVTTFNNSFNDLKSKFHREPSVSELADDLSWSIKDTERMMTMNPDNITGSFFDVSKLGIESKKDNLDRSMIYAFYYDLPVNEQKIFEYSTGYLGTPIIDNNEICKRLNMLEGDVVATKIKISRILKKYI